MTNWFKVLSETIENLERLGGYKVSFIFLFLCALISPGFLILFQYKRDVFMSLELLKLLMLSIGLSVPILLVSIVISGAVGNKFSYLNVVFSGSGLSLGYSYSSLFIAYICNVRFMFFLVILGMLVVFGCFQAWLDNRQSSQTKNEA
ncbi:hypothetical protein [Vibrio cholerae]|uniref:hypothetical protein n=1 Tax=Vibrio cholerae TaxID=666 RepID=UPI000BA8EA29|nr:hypothetical protein [Vibrio cholerae]EHD2271260.1 hypothetical protein [Vibrio cholerae]EIC2299229.1 hypothetical protein [Vibrio cholerae]EIJ2221490.1 hypothetical protein [Vibrio cholerae]EJL6912774.1 hypothetical protein [Vibrio cholerae]EJL6998808.1 hypothetical protein [Vibrio cholerae]